MGVEDTAEALRAQRKATAADGHVNGARLKAAATNSKATARATELAARVRYDRPPEPTLFVHYTEFSGMRHAVWDKDYDQPTLFPWLFSKSLAVGAK